MNYLTVSQISESQASTEAKIYLRELWYAIVEGQFSISRKFNMYKYQMLHLQACAPKDWKLEWNGIYFTLSKDFQHHARVTIMLKPNGTIQYYFS
ncbi:MAG TPA: hypothetical protein VEY70_17265 [Metabacillus sp.]|nr:hypothetical protein [Metabacillus sp.]